MLSTQITLLVFCSKNHTRMVYAIHICNWQLYNTLSVPAMWDEVSTGQILTFSKDFLAPSHLYICCALYKLISTYICLKNFITKNKFWKVKIGEPSSVMEKLFLAYDWNPNKHDSWEVTPMFVSIWQKLLLLWRDKLLTLFKTRNFELLIGQQSSCW
jgi:hypothetical protein